MNNRMTHAEMLDKAARPSRLDPIECAVLAVNLRDEIFKLDRANATMLEALQEAQGALRGIYDAIEDGRTAKSIYADQALWPLSTVREAIAAATGEAVQA